MANELSITSDDAGTEITWEKTVRNEDGTSETIRVEKVTNGFIKSVSTRKKEGDDWKYEDVKSIHKDNPFKEKSLVDKLEESMNGEED